MALNVQVISHHLSIEAEGTKNDINLRSGSGTPIAAFMHRSGNRNGVPGSYGNVNWSDGFWDGATHAAWTFMSDYEVAGNVDTRRAHTLMGAAIRTQKSSGADQRDIDEIYDFTAASIDTLEINNLIRQSNDDCESLVVPFTGGITSQEVGEIALPVGAGTANIELNFVADLLLIGHVARTVAPTVDDAKVDDGGPGQNAYEKDAMWCTGVAWNDTSTVQRCMAMEEDRTQGLPTPPYPADHSFVIRNDAVATRLSNGGVTDYTVSVTDWESGVGNTEIELTATAGANGEYLVYHAIKFDDPTKVAVVDTTMPGTSGDWEKTGLSEKPQLVIARCVMNAAAYNTVYQADYSLNTIIFDAFDCFTSTITAPYNENPTDGTGNALTQNDVTCYAEFTGGVDTIEAQYGQPTLTDDGWVATAVTSPTDDFLGFAVVFFEDPISLPIAVGGYATV